MKDDILKFAASLLELNQAFLKILEAAFDKDEKLQDKFRDWYNREEGKFTKFLVMLLVVLSLLNFIAFLVSMGVLENSRVTETLTGENIKKTLYASETFCLFLISANIILFTRFDIPKTDNPILQWAFNSSDRFLHYWPLLWASWFALYGLLTLEAFGVVDEKGNVFLAFTNACNNLSGVLIYSMYYEMAERTDSSSAYGKKIWILAGMLLAGLLLLELIFTTNRENAVEISYLFSFVSGIIVGIATGLLVTKLASRIISPPFWAVTVLILYTVIQPAFPIIAGSKSLVAQSTGEVPAVWGKLTIVVALIAFYGKVVLFGVVHWMRDTDRLIYYMARARRLHKEETDAELRQIFDLVVKAGKNLVRWRESGKPRAWVEKHEGKWSEEELESLLITLKASEEFRPMEPDAVKAVLEETRREWLQERKP